MILYHRTSAAAAGAILKGGFKDGTDSYSTPYLHTGVWLSNVPLDSNEGAKEGPLLGVELNLTEEELAEYEWVEEDKPYREWLVPAAVINAHCTITVVTDPDLELFV